MKAETNISQEDQECYEKKMKKKFGIKEINGEKVIMLKSREMCEKNAHKHMVKVPRVLVETCKKDKSQLANNPD